MTGEALGILGLTLYVSVAATALGAVIGIPLGVWLGSRPAAAGRLLRTLTYAFYGLPPVVAGLVVYLVLSRQGPLGALGLLFTPEAIILAETLLATPLIAGLTVAALAEVSAPVREAVRAAGATGFRFHAILLVEARLGVLAAVMIGFGRALAEVAAALMVGGNIRGRTRTLGTSILQDVNQGEFGQALRMACLLLALAFVTFLVLSRLDSAHRRQEDA